MMHVKAYFTWKYRGLTLQKEMLFKEAVSITRYVAVSFTNTRDWLQGRVLVYRRYNPRTYTHPMQLLHNITGMALYYTHHSQCTSLCQNMKDSGNILPKMAVVLQNDTLIF